MKEGMMERIVRGKTIGRSCGRSENKIAKFGLS
jgi:hypothetical protein